LSSLRVCRRGSKPKNRVCRVTWLPQVGWSFFRPARCPSGRRSPLQGVSLFLLFLKENRRFGGGAWFRGHGLGNADITSTLGTFNDKTRPQFIYDHPLTTRAAVKRDVHVLTCCGRSLPTSPPCEQGIFSTILPRSWPWRLQLLNDCAGGSPVGSEARLQLANGPSSPLRCVYRPSW